jgi:nitrogen fixation protein
LEKEANAERRTTAMLAERAARAAAAAAAIAKRDREEAVRQEAIGLGPVTVDPQWEVELASLAEELAALRASVE